MGLFNITWPAHLKDHNFSTFFLILTAIILLSYIICFLCVQLYKRNYLSTFVLRKLFHFLVFTLAWYIQTFFGLLNLIFFAAIMFTAVLATATIWQDNSLYKFLQNKNASNKKSSVIYPLFATAAGGILSNLFFAKFAAIGYLAAGWGDVSGALVGNIMLTHHLTRSNSIKRSIAGSIAVFLFSSLAVYIGLYFVQTEQPNSLIAIATGMICSIVEVFSKCEIDNMTLQLTVTSVLFLLN